MMVRYVPFVVIAAIAFISSVAAYAADKVNYTISWLPTGEEAYPYVGMQEGYFAAEGLELNIIVSRGSREAITKMIAGQADFADVALGALMGAAAEADVPIKALSSIYSKQPDCIF